MVGSTLGLVPATLPDACAFYDLTSPPPKAERGLKLFRGRFGSFFGSFFSQFCAIFLIELIFSQLCKQSFCLGDTRHLRHFRRCPGSEELNPSFLWVECNIRIFADFRQNHLFSAGTKTPFSKTTVSWEVLNGVGVDGVGAIFPFFPLFYAFSPYFTHFSPFFTHFSPFSSLFSASPLVKNKGKQQQFTAKMGNFPSFDNTDFLCLGAISLCRGAALTISR